MYFTVDQIWHQHLCNPNECDIVVSISEWDRISSFLYGKSFRDFLIISIFPGINGHKDSLEKLNEINNEIHKCLLSLQDPKHLRIEIYKNTIETVEVQIFYKDKFLEGNVYNTSNYLQQTYIKLIHMYKPPKFSELVHYTKIFKRDKIINGILK